MGGFFTGVESPGMIDWATMPTYNTIMSVAVGAGPSPSSCSIGN